MLKNMESNTKEYKTIIFKNGEPFAIAKWNHDRFETIPFDKSCYEFIMEMQFQMEVEDLEKEFQPILSKYKIVIGKQFGLKGISDSDDPEIVNEIELRGQRAWFNYPKPLPKDWELGEAYITREVAFLIKK